ncbi:MAG TPA: TlpA disulfide reductase family protein [Noviherbaspirillum sp.]
MKLKTILFSLIAIAFAVLGAAVGHRMTTPEPADAKAVDILFAQVLPDPQGKMQPLTQWKNKPLVVNFWATWCAPCVEEMPELAQLNRELAPVGARVLGIGIDTADNIVRFAEKHAIDFPLFVAGANATELTRRFGNNAGGLPFTVLIDASGAVRKTYLGRLKMDELRRDLGEL